MRIPFYILARVPILSSDAALAKALFCPYVELCRASTVLQHTVMLSLTCYEQATIYCTYGHGKHPHVAWDQAGKAVIFTTEMPGDPNVCVATIPGKWQADNP